MLSYLKEKRTGLIFFFLTSAVWGIFIYLYRFPFAAFLYPFSISAALGLVFLAFSFAAFRRKAEALKSTSFPIVSPLPAPETEADAEYQRLIADLTRETEKSLTEAEEKRKDAEEYFTVWAHQIKTPIASMRLSLENEDGNLSRKLRSDLNRTEQYVGMVLTYLRLDRSASDYVFRETPLDPLIRSAAKRFAPDFISKKIGFVFEPTGKSVVTDEKWLSFVLEQLLSNAVKYTKEGTVTVSVTEPLTLSVADTGIGIAPEDLPRVFEKGYTGHNGRTDLSASGIGLYLCRRVCEALGVGIRAESEPGKGTTVFLDLSKEHGRYE